MGKICVVTGARSEYGLLYWLMKRLHDKKEFELQIIATGMHLSPEFGLTYQQIEADGFEIDLKVDMLLSSDSPVAIAKSIGLGVIGFADAFERLQPTIVVLLGDRFEIFAAAQAAIVAGSPIAHIHGGELSEGAFDDSIRHSITKMSIWHFVAAEEYRRRVIQLGEAPDRVINVGAPGLEHLDHLDWMTKKALEIHLGITLSSPTFLVTYHPVTLEKSEPMVAFEELLSALDEFPDAKIIFTYPNADTGGRKLISLIDAYVGNNPGRAKAFVSLGQRVYLSLLRHVDVAIGNSSSGLIEAPALKVATVNLGDRQGGRLRALSVIDAVEERSAIAEAVRTALSPDFKATLANVEPPYGSGGVSSKIIEVLMRPVPSIKKSFFDIPHGY